MDMRRRFEENCRRAQNAICKAVSAIGALQSSHDDLKGSVARKVDLESGHSTLQERVEYLEGALGDSAQKHAQELRKESEELKSAHARHAQALEDLKAAQTDRESAKTAMAEATAIREKEAAAFAAYKADADANVAAITKATAAVEKGMGSAFLQTPGAAVLRNLVKNNDNLDGVQELASFLEQGSDYAPQSGAITGILKQMGDTMAADLADETAKEDEAIKAFEGLIAAKTKEVEALTKAVEAKTKLIGELGVEIVEMKEDLDDTAKGYESDKKFLKQLEKGCGTMTEQWAERQKVRAEELVALADTIKVLNDDDALDLFKKTLPSSSSSFLQVTVTSKSMRERALKILRSARGKKHGHRSQLDFLVLALSGQQKMSSVDFTKVTKMIDDMVAVLKKEQNDDEDKKEYCEKAFDEADDKKKQIERSNKDIEVSIENTKEAIATLTEEMSALEEGIKALDKSVAEATESRKEENEEYKSLMASDTAAVELLGFAKNRLNKFYNPKLYKAPPKQELTEEERIAVNMGGDAPTTPAPGGIAGTGIGFVQIQMHTQSEAPRRRRRRPSRPSPRSPRRATA